MSKDEQKLNFFFKKVLIFWIIVIVVFYKNKMIIAMLDRLKKPYFTAYFKQYTP